MNEFEQIRELCAKLSAECKRLKEVLAEYKEVVASRAAQVENMPAPKGKQ